MTVATIPDDALSFVCTLVRDRSAIELEASKSYLIEARLAPLAKQHGFPSPSDFIEGVRTKRRPDLERSMIEAMTTNETTFFRDLHPFEALRTKVVPEIITRNASQRTLNIWSAACSTGQELYSIAMLLREHFPALLSWKLGLIGTDLSEEVLNKARAARYSQIEINRGLPANLLMKYFQRDGMQWKLAPDLAATAKFSKLNLIESWPTMPAFDVVMLRNVLIYFSCDTKKAILRKIRQVMAPRGVLFLGAAETTTGLDSSFEREQAGQCVYYRVK
jgi:chemotaxis protein methyltransferase CheR